MLAFRAGSGLWRPVASKLCHQAVAVRSANQSVQQLQTPSQATRAASFSNSDSFLSASNSSYIDEMFAQWRRDPASVHKSWQVYFSSGQYTAPPTLVADYDGSSSSSAPVASVGSVDAQHVTDLTRVVQMVRAFQVRGHFLAHLDPLDLTKPRMLSQELDPSNYGFTESDLNRVVDMSSLDPRVKGFLGSNVRATIGQIYDRLKAVYCGRIGFEYMHIPDVEQCNWVRNKVETYEATKLSKQQRIKLLERLTWADHFEQFLALKWPAAKRFGLEGGEALIPGMKAMLYKGSELGVESVVMGMPHRGRLNILSTVIRKPIEQIFSEFGKHMPDPATVEGTGDVKYHLGMSLTRELGNGKTMSLSMMANPSHLEAVNPLVVGKVRAKQFDRGDTERSKVVGVLLHGDAAFAGQGIVYETMGMSSLADYTTGGVVHIVVNNQIGYTTNPGSGRSSPYCTDIAKAFNAPIFHVNGDDPEAVAYVHELAIEFRQKFKKDVVVDLVCYRKRGHNEADEPRFTQPEMYQKIDKMPSVYKQYSAQLVKDGAVTQEEVAAMSKQVNQYFHDKFESAKNYKPKPSDWLSKRWAGLKAPSKYAQPRITGVPIETLRQVGYASINLPEDFTVHPNLKRHLIEKRKAALDSGKGIDWGLGEAMAFGSLLLEGHHVRLSGQDVERGTFSHRHAVLHDQKNYTKFVPLNHLSAKQAPFSVSNSSLSEYGVLGFELGYSQEHPNNLVLWEAQFGDFFNGAQIIVDQFLSSGEDKWLRQSGLVVLLPHGYEGAGPEHSSARLERFLQMTNDHPDIVPEGDNQDQSRQIQTCNWQVLNCSTPANYFHALRRQLHREFRKPLIIASPKSLLKLPLSDIEDFGPGTKFKKVIGEPENLDGRKVRRLIFCSGKVYYNLMDAKAAKEQATGQKITDIAVARIEQIAPFPFSLVAEEARRFPNAEIVWMQEEPMNMGAWTYVQPRIETALRADRAARPRYVGRQPSAAPATGSMGVHENEQAAVLAAALA